jgi:AcrR family transcriptional regulator
MAILLEVETLRQRNRRNAMRTTQRAALTMFIERGFDDVTVSEIAAEVGMAASTLYRHFRTKEDIVIWDEHDPAIDDALEKALKKRAPLDAIRHVFVHELAARYESDVDFQLQRLQYLYRTPQLRAASAEADLRMHAELTAGLQHFMTKPNRPAAEVIAGAALVALDTAINRWQANNAKRPLAELIDNAFEYLGRLNSLR